MTESNWQGDMLRQMAEQSPAEQPDRPETQPVPPPAPGGQGDAVVPPQRAAPPEQPGQWGQQGYEQQAPYPQQPYQEQQPYPPQQYQGQQHQQQPYQQPYPQQGYEQQGYQQQPYEQQGYQQQPYQGPPQQGYSPQQYQEQYPYQQQPYPPEQYPQQQYQQQATYQEQYPPQQGYQQQYAPPYEQPPLDEQYPPQGQHNPGQLPHQDFYDQPPQQPAGGSWATPPSPQSDQIGTPLQEPDGDSVFRRFRRIASEAAYLVGGSGRLRRDVDSIASIRRPIAIMRRIGVLSPVTNAGTSTVTALLSTILSVQRSDRVVAVDADPGGAELSRRLEPSLGAGPIEGVSLVRSEGTADALRATLAEVQGQGARDVGLAVVDCPGSMFDEIGSEMASSGHCAVLVVPSPQHVAEYCLAQLDQLPAEGQDILLNRGVIVISVVQNVHPGSVNWLVEQFQRRGMEPVVVPYDAHIATAWPLQTGQLQSETRQALLELAARVVETVTRAAS
ncbi:MinD/ParA family ATP-binding protein [Kribbella sp. NPDC054772]